MTSNADCRTITAATVLISIPAYLVGFPDLYYFVFLPYRIFTIKNIPEIWRFFTNFLITGPKIGMILDPYFLYRYSSSLETTAARFSQPGDYFVYLIFCAVIIIVSQHTLTSSALQHPFMHKTSYICPYSLVLTVTVPGNEGDHPCTAQCSSFANLKECLWSAGMVGFQI